MECPKCHNEISDAAVECPHCHIVVAQYLKRLRQKAAGAEKPGAPAPVAEEKKGPPLWLVVLLVAALAGYSILRFTRHKPEPQPAVATAPAEPNAPETMAAPAPPSDAPDTASVDALPQDSSATVESNDSNASAESFNKGEKRIKKLVHGASPMLPGNPGRVLDNK